MNKEQYIQKVLDGIHLSEGETFEYDRSAIVQEYQKEEEKQSSLSIKVLSIIGGFLASLAFLLFLVLGGLWESELALLLFGIALIAVSVFLNKKHDKLIIDTFAISIYLIGFFLVAAGLFEYEFDENNVALLFIVLSIATLVITQNYILSFISILIISASLLVLMLSNKLDEWIHLYLAFYTFLFSFWVFKEAKLMTLDRRISRLYEPVRIGLLFSFLFGLILIGKRDLISISQNLIWLSSIPIVFVIIYLINRVARITNIKSQNNKLLVYSLSVLILIPTLFSPAISGAILIVLLSFFVNYKTGLTIGIISFIYFISQYYYDLNFTLLTKSILLLSSGIMFIVFYLLTSQKFNRNEKI